MLNILPSGTTIEGMSLQAVSESKDLQDKSRISSVPEFSFRKEEYISMIADQSRDRA
jgi:hypothetical protein